MMRWWLRAPDGKLTWTEDYRVFQAWAVEDGDDNSKIEQTKIGLFEVSTVFFPIALGFGPDGQPLLYETMIFFGKGDQISSEFQYRYDSEEKARAGHALAVQLLHGGADPTRLLPIGGPDAGRT